MARIMILLFVLIPLSSFSQEYMDKIAGEACKCLEGVENGAMEDGYVEKLGLCMIAASQPYEKELKRDYNIDFERIDEEGERLGKIIAMKMVGVCPNSLAGLGKKVNEMKAAKSVAPVEEYSGKIVKVEVDQFLVIHIKDKAGKVNKFYWLDFVESNVEITEKLSQLNGKSADLKFTSREMLDPNTREYRKFSVVKEFDLK